MTPTRTDLHDGPVQPMRDTGVVLHPLPRGAVSITGDGMLGNWQRLNGDATIPHCIEQLEASGVLDNFRRVVGRSDAAYRGFPFADSDAYKTLEAVAWEIGRSGTHRFDAFVDATVELLGAVQTDDGYLNSCIQGGGGTPLSDLRWSHELYCLGHLIQAAVAFKRVADRDDLLHIALRSVELVERVLGPDGRPGVDGHPEIETALVELYRTTGDRRHLALARHFVEIRGHRTVGRDRLGYEYFQDHEPVRDVTEATGHAVRQMYLAAGVTDLVTEEPDPGLADALDRIWDSAHHQKMYITGGLGSRHRDEAFGDPYELPPDRAYSETCASIANFSWNWRMLLRSGDSRYADEMERGLYNSIAASTGIDGTHFFYANPLQLREGHRSEENAPAGRTAWYDCACCPPNLARLVGSLDAYVATASDEGVQLHLFADATIVATGTDGAPVALAVRTAYPWDGSVRIELDRKDAGVALRLRRPGWVKGYTVTVDGERREPAVEHGYLLFPAGSVTRSIEIRFDDTPVAEHPHPHIDAARGTVAVRRGPVVYALEQPDLPDDVPVADVLIPVQPRLRVGPVDDRLGVPTIEVESAISRDSSVVPLYAVDRPAVAERPLGPITLIPYFRWANRRQAAMRVWIPTR